MKIISVRPIVGKIIEVDGSWPNIYTRYSSKSWTVSMGESDETVFNFDDLEAAYQKWEAEKK